MMQQRDCPECKPFRSGHCPWQRKLCHQVCTAGQCHARSCVFRKQCWFSALHPVPTHYADQRVRILSGGLQQIFVTKMKRIEFTHNSRKNRFLTHFTCKLLEFSLVLYYYNIQQRLHSCKSREFAAVRPQVFSIITKTVCRAFHLQRQFCCCKELAGFHFHNDM